MWRNIEASATRHDDSSGDIKEMMAAAAAKPRKIAIEKHAASTVVVHEKIALRRYALAHHLMVIASEYGANRPSMAKIKAACHRPRGIGSRHPSCLHLLYNDVY